MSLPKMFFPPVVDDSMLASFRNCPQKFAWEYGYHYKPESNSIHLHAGAAFASGLESVRDSYYVQGKDAEQSLLDGIKTILEEYGDFECPDRCAKTADRMMGALEFYFHHYPLDSEGQPSIIGGKRAIEFSFAIPFPYTHPELDQPIIYSGRTDMICDFAGGTYIEDDKTATSLGPTWASKWDLRGQFTGYSWGAREYGIPVDGILIRGVSILKTKYDTQQAITYRPDFMIEDWLRQCKTDLAEIELSINRGWWRRNFSDVCNNYGNCVFSRCCQSADPQPWLDSYFIKKVWDPLNRQEISPEQWEAEWKK